MSIEKFKARVELLQQEHLKATSNINLLTEQLEKSKIHLHMVTGHMNEANFHLQEAQSSLAIGGCVVPDHENKDIENGHIEHEEAK